MKKVITLIKNDWIESVRSNKLLILGLIFLLLGLSNPLMAKLTPELLPSLLPDNFPLEIPPATTIDAWSQFYKNMSQLLMILFFIMFCGTLTNDFTKGRIIPLLTKGLKRRTVIIAKWLHLILQWTLLFAINLAASWIYTLLLLPGELNHLLIASIFLWTYGIFLITLLILFSVLFMNIYGVLIGVGGVSLLLSIISIATVIQPYNPARLGTDNLLLLSNTLTLSDFLPSFFITISLIPLLLVLSVRILNKKSL